MDDHAKQLLIRKYVEQWENDHPQLVEDIGELSAKVVMFNMMWGTDFYIAHRPLRSEDIDPSHKE